MAHNLETTKDGVAMFCVGNREAAWHHLGQRTDKAQNWQQAMKLAKLDWDVSKIQLKGRDPLGVTKPVASWGIFRNTDGNFLGAVGPTYSPIQNKKAFDFVDALLEAENGAHYESAGALGQGERIWTMARIPHEIQIKGTDDKSLVYLLFTNSHNGSSSATAKLSTVRVVCQNTLNAALETEGSFVRFRHTADGIRKIEHAKKIMTGVTMDVKALESKLNDLATRRMTKETMLSVLDSLFPKPAEDTILAARNRRDNLVLQVLKLYESNDKNAIPQIRGTAYNLLNAVTEFTDHEKKSYAVEDGETVETVRAENALFGTGDKFKGQALETILKLTASNPTRSRKQFAGVALAEPEVAPATELPADLQAQIDSVVDRTLKL